MKSDRPEGRESGRPPLGAFIEAGHRLMIPRERYGITNRAPISSIMREHRIGDRDLVGDDLAFDPALPVASSRRPSNAKESKSWLTVRGFAVDDNPTRAAEEMSEYDPRREVVALGVGRILQVAVPFARSAPVFW